MSWCKSGPFDDYLVPLILNNFLPLDRTLLRRRLKTHGLSFINGTLNHELVFPTQLEALFALLSRMTFAIRIFCLGPPSGRISVNFKFEQSII